METLPFSLNKTTILTRFTKQILLLLFNAFETNLFQTHVCITDTMEVLCLRTYFEQVLLLLRTQ
jgi:hypothetical protein